MSPLLTRPSRADRGLVLLLALLCAAITVGSASASVYLRTTADDLAGQLFRDALHPATQVTVTYTGVTDPYVRPGAEEQVEQALSPAVRPVLDEPRHAVVSPEMVPQVLPPDPGVPGFLTVASLPGLDDLVTIETGRSPRPGRPVRPLPPRIAQSYIETIAPSVAGLDREPGEAEVVEVILETSAAREIEVMAGSWVALSATRFQGEDVVPAVLHVVGTYRAADPYPSPLDDIDTARKPMIDPTPDARTVRLTALAADGDTVFGATWEAEPDLRWTFDLAGTPSAAGAERLVELGRGIELQSWPSVADADGVGAETGLGDIAAAVVSQRDTSDGMALLGLTALAGAGLAVLLAAAVVLAGRREAPTTVVRARGASPGWLVVQRGGEALLIAAPGVLAAVAVVLGLGGSPLSLPVVVAVATSALCVALVTAAQTVPRTGREPTTVQLVLRDSVQLVLVLLAAAVTWVVVRRGSVDSGEPVTLVLAPVLGCAAAVVVLRLLRPLLRGLRHAAAGTRRLTPVVSLSQAVAISQQVVVAGAAVVLAVSSAVVAVALTDTLRSGSEQTAWEQVGSDVVVQAPGLQDETADILAGLPGVESTSPVFTSPSVSLDTALGVEGVRLVAFDPAAMREVTRESPLPIDLPQGTGEELPVLVSPDLELADDVTQLRYAQAIVPVRVVERMERIPGVTTGESFVAVDIAALTAAAERNLTSYDVILIRGTPDVSQVEQVVRERAPLGVVRSRADLTDDQLTSPVVTRTTALLLAVAVSAVAVAAFAVVLLVSLGGPVRRRTSALLLTLGADPRQARRVSALGVVPLVAGACVAALGCGVLLVVVADQGLDLAGLTGSVTPLRVRPSGWTALLTGAACVALVMLAGLAASRSTRHLDDTDRPGAEHR